MRCSVAEGLLRVKGRIKDGGSGEGGLKFGEGIGGVEKSLDGGTAAAH